MKKIGPAAGGIYFYTMNMYFIAIVCPPEIDEHILAWKMWMKEKYDCQVALRSPAHITLVPPFWMRPDLEDDLKTSLAKFSTSKSAIGIRLNNFSYFKPRVIFVDVDQNKMLADLRLALCGFLMSENKFPLEKEDRPFHPHVTIATRDLYKKSFYDAWDHFKEKKYKAEWTADGVSLMRHNKKNWEVIITFQLTQTLE